MSFLMPSLEWPMIAAFVALIASIWILVGAAKAGRLLLEGDARKINHFAILVGAVLWFNTGVSDVDRVSCRVACGILFLLLLAVCRFRDDGLCRLAFLGYARESDRPNDAFHVWFSWLVSMAGLQLVDLFFGSIELTRLAALVLGVGDAIAEPVGRRFGKHRYRVQGILSPHGATRSWEGSTAVAISSALVVMLFSGLIFAVAWPQLLGFGLVTGFLVAVIEAWTPHGLDNFTIPLSTAVILRCLMTTPGFVS